MEPINGPSVTLEGASTAKPTFKAPKGPASLEFELEVCDNGTPSLCSTDTVKVTVNRAGSGRRRQRGSHRQWQGQCEKDEQVDLRADQEPWNGNPDGLCQRRQLDSYGQRLAHRFRVAERRVQNPEPGCQDEVHIHLELRSRNGESGRYREIHGYRHRFRR